VLRDSFDHPAARRHAEGAIAECGPRELPFASGAIQRRDRRRAPRRRHNGL